MDFEVPILTKSSVFHDHRGYFFPLRTEGFSQSNLSYNAAKWTFRGMHFQEKPYDQKKFINVIKGKIVDFVIDIREDSPMYATVETYFLDEGDQLLVPNGYAHGFLTLEDETLVQYLVDAPYKPSHEKSIQWDTVTEIEETVMEEIGFDRKLIIINDKDKIALDFETLFRKKRTRTQRD